MNKSFLPLAALTLTCGIAHAQTTVSIGGIIDLGFVKSTGQALQETANKQNRLYFAGTEDLGGGITANFKLDERFLLDTGAFATTLLWQGESWVGLASKTMGEVRFGRQYSPSYTRGSQRVDPFAGEGIPTTINSYLLGATRYNNATTYISPTIAGFALWTQYALSEVGIGVGKQNGHSTSLIYDQGPVSANISYDKSVGSDAYFGNVGAGYVFGPAKITIGYSRGDTKVPGTGITKGAQLGLDYVLSSGNHIKATASTLDNATGALSRQVGGGYEYYFSKLTNLYALVNRDQHLSLTSGQVGITKRF